ncbi:MAG: translation initiation factor IF-2 subunit beta [Candidatus Pacearchaeota archaeon]|nr:MAG: translation initiation factor IF-2 subunit beta [Candidatus Pacearchaeota archaeon]
MENYETLLEEAYKKIKRIENQKDRFEIPKIEGHFEGKKTVLTNFYQIASYLRRNPEHFQKFILKELAAAGQKENDRLVLNIRVPSSKINQKIEEYVREYVICKECKKPDTELLRDSHVRVSYLKCLACGAKHPVK